MVNRPLTTKICDTPANFLLDRSHCWGRRCADAIDECRQPLFIRLDRHLDSPLADGNQSRVETERDMSGGVMNYDQMREEQRRIQEQQREEQRRADELRRQEAIRDERRRQDDLRRQEEQRRRIDR